MKQFIKIITTFLLMINIHEQRISAYSITTIKPASTAIGIVAGGVTTLLVFRALEKTSISETDAVADSILEQTALTSLEDIKDIDDIIIVNSDQLQNVPKTHTIRNLIASLLLGTATGFAVKILSEALLLEFCEMLSMHFEKNRKSENNSFEDFFHLFSQNNEKKKALKTLGFTDGENPTQDEIRVRYKKLAIKKHPDRGGTTEEFQKINEAYELLKPSPQK